MSDTIRKVNRGFVIDPSTEPRQEELFNPETGDVVYALARNGVAETSLEVFPTWEEANNVAQSFKNGLDLDPNLWGVVPITVQ